MQTRMILGTDAAWHDAFFRFVTTIFGGSSLEDWRVWGRRGGWTDAYDVFALVDGDRIVSTIGRTRMRLAVNGQSRVGYQLGAVGTLPAERGRGHARRLLNWVFQELDGPDQPIMLFANDTVFDFYPRFGFRRVGQLRSTAAVSIDPAGGSASRVDLASAGQRQALAALYARAAPAGGVLAARDYYPVLLWHLTCRPITGYWLPKSDAVICVAESGGQLVIHDAIAPRPFDLSSVVPTLISRAITAVEFGFDATGWWAGTETGAWDDPRSRLFVRGGLPAGPVQFPGLAHT